MPTLDGTGGWARAHPYYRYAVAVGFAALATVLKVALAAYVVPTYIIAYPFVLFAAAVGGIGPGILTTALSALAAWFWVLPPPGRFHALDVQEASALILFLAMGVLMSVVAERLRRFEGRVGRLEGERELRAAEERFKTYVEESPDGILVTDAAGRIVDANLALLRMLGSDLAALRGTPASDLAVGAERRDSADTFEAVSHGGRVEHDRKFLRSDGSVVWARVRAVKLADDRVVKFCRDITDRKVAEEAQARLVVELKEALDNVRTLTGLLPICMYCKKIRNDEGYWDRIESYISTHTEARFSHGICEDCFRVNYPEMVKSGDSFGG